jgi:UDP-N-acetylglucosamine transferase subunit ALG13
MIFATVGTHEQPMNRLMRALEQLAAVRPDLGPFIVQYGYSTPPRGWHGSCLMNTDEMASYIQEATAVVTHGGPATIAACLKAGKMPVVVPRLRRFGEHVDDHQLAYARVLAKRGEIVVVEDLRHLPEAIGQLVESGRSATAVQAPDIAGAVQRFARIADLLVGGGDRPNGRPLT